MTPAKKKTIPPALYELETEVMDEMWRRDSGTVREVLEALNRGRTTRAYTTIMTTMVRLYRKGLLTREPAGRGHRYTVSMTRDAYREARAEAEVGALVDEFGELALAHFSEHLGALDPERLSELRRLAKG